MSLSPWPRAMLCLIPECFHNPVHTLTLRLLSKHHSSSIVFFRASTRNSSMLFDPQSDAMTHTMQISAVIVLFPCEVFLWTSRRKRGGGQVSSRLNTHWLCVERPLDSTRLLSVLLRRSSANPQSLLTWTARLIGGGRESDLFMLLPGIGNLSLRFYNKKTEEIRSGGRNINYSEEKKVKIQEQNAYDTHSRESWYLIGM